MRVLTGASTGRRHKSTRLYRWYAMRKRYVRCILLSEISMVAFQLAVMDWKVCN